MAIGFNSIGASDPWCRCRKRNYAMSIKRLFDAVERRGDIGRRAAALILPISNRPRVTSRCAGKIGLREPGEDTSGPNLTSRNNVAHSQTLYTILETPPSVIPLCRKKARTYAIRWSHAGWRAYNVGAVLAPSNEYCPAVNVGEPREGAASGRVRGLKSSFAPHETRNQKDRHSCRLPALAARDLKNSNRQTSSKNCSLTTRDCCRCLFRSSMHKLFLAPSPVPD
jgi:hypothetical protein